jgi:hypothetical protein
MGASLLTCCELLEVAWISAMRHCCCSAAKPLHAAANSHPTHSAHSQMLLQEPTDEPAAAQRQTAANANRPWFFLSAGRSAPRDRV